jgi:hypothetical protein
MTLQDQQDPQTNLVSHPTPSRHAIEAPPISDLSTGRASPEPFSRAPSTTQYASNQYESAKLTQYETNQEFHPTPEHTIDSRANNDTGLRQGYVAPKFSSRATLAQCGESANLTQSTNYPALYSTPLEHATGSRTISNTVDTWGVCKNNTIRKQLNEQSSRYSPRSKLL